MKINEKLVAIAEAEQLDISSLPSHEWLAISNFLNQPKIEKYSVWFTTGKIFPEAGQISPELTHFGPSKTIY
ncbi:hypothetical protein [Yersinia enterocolitica]|uniref:hypothetical protein n=1 Tax=Yersinia enterocolitica TaxID=630 RepID=UPI0021AE1C31|nr:hypothetical protein [Yersinia enterocolitica]